MTKMNYTYIQFFITMCNNNKKVYIEKKPFFNSTKILLSCVRIKGIQVGGLSFYLFFLNFSGLVVNFFLLNFVP